MTDISVIIDWNRQTNFIKQLNQKFNISQMDGTNKNYKLIITNTTGTSISDYVDSNGCLNITTYEGVDMKLKYNVNNYNDSFITTVDDTTHTFTEGYSMMRAIMIIQKDTKYVLFYNIRNVSLPVSNKLILPANSELCTIKTEVE